MSKPFRLWQFISGNDACNYHRMILPARHCGDIMRKEGVEILPYHHIPNGGLPTGGDEFSAFTWHALPNDFDKVIGIGTRWRMEGKKVLWSIDDDYTSIPSWNPVANVQTAGGSTVAKWASICTDAVMCSTDNLAATLPPNPLREVHVAPNLLELWLYKPWPRDPGTIRIMYAGSPTHIGDLEQVVEVVTHVLDNYQNVEFVFMGCCHPEIRRRHLHAGMHEIPHAPMKDYWNILCSYAPDIAICPLVDCAFNQSKSGLKVMEMMALEAAVIASDVEPYRDVIQSGENGILVNPEDDGEEWKQALCLLVEDAGMRKRLQEAGRETVENRYNWLNNACIAPWLDYYRAVAGIV